MSAELKKKKKKAKGDEMKTKYMKNDKFEDQII